MPDPGTSNHVMDPDAIHRYLDLKIEDATRRQELFTFLFVEFRGIRRINTVIGHQAGDACVRTLIDRVRATLPDGDIVGRISSDELVIVSLDCNSPSCAIKGSRAALDALREPVFIDGTECLSDPVVGISIHPNDGMTSSELVRHAALAAQRASVDEDPHYAFFSAGLGEDALREFDLQQQVRKATSQGQFELHYQPKVDAATLATEGCEALIRWRDPERGLRSPGEFLGAAERGGLMVPIGFFVLREACIQLRNWLDAGYASAAISINVTPGQLAMRDWVSLVAAEIRRAKIPPFRLTLEITEGSAIRDGGDMIEKLNDLRMLGVRISIDDFGTGHSSLAYLAKLPVDEIKIDRVFIQSAIGCETNARICRNVIELAHGLGAKVTAEGVETSGQAEWLRGIGCDLLQGFLFDRPAPSADFEPWLRPGANGRAMLDPGRLAV